MDLVIASNNKHKLREIKEILGDFFMNIRSLSDEGLNIDIDETGTTFAENAYIKASTVVALTGKPALADDSGLQVTALGGAPGVFSARYGGEHGNDERNIEKLLENLKNATDRSASFTSCVCLCFPDGSKRTAEGKTFGRILEKKDGQNGFGYDPVFFSDDLQKSFGMASEEEKNAVSHRGRALAALVAQLKK